MLWGILPLMVVVTRKRLAWIQWLVWDSIVYLVVWLALKHVMRGPVWYDVIWNPAEIPLNPPKMEDHFPLWMSKPTLCFVSQALPFTLRTWNQGSSIFCKLSTGCLAVSDMFWMVIYHLSSLSLSLSLLLSIIVNCHYIGRLIAWTLDFLTGGWNHQIQPERYPLSSSVSTFRVSWSPRLLSHSWHWLGA
jgi:hypothetical protein